MSSYGVNGTHHFPACDPLDLSERVRPQSVLDPAMSKGSEEEQGEQGERIMVKKYRPIHGKSLWSRTAQIPASGTAAPRTW